MTARTGRDLTAELAYLTRALKAPTLRGAVDRLAERARAESWTTRSSSSAVCNAKSPPATATAAKDASAPPGSRPAKSLEEFDYDHARGLKRDLIAHLGTLDFVTAKDNVLLLGPPGTGKTHLATGLAIRACQAGHGVLFATAAQWVTRLADAHTSGRLQDELPGSAATRCSSSTGSATSRSSPKPPTCSSNSSPAATSAPASSSPVTSRSAGGVRSSATKSSPPP